jgi:hypothetical protein
MEKSRRHSKRSDHYQTMAAGYQILISPLAEAYNAAAALYRESDPPLDPSHDRPDQSETLSARNSARQSGGD